MAAPTNSELLIAYKSALLSVTAGQSYSINGRTLSRANLSEIMKVIDWLEQRVAADDTTVDETGTGIALAKFNN